MGVSGRFGTVSTLRIESRLLAWQDLCPGVSLAHPGLRRSLMRAYAYVFPDWLATSVNALLDRIRRIGYLDIWQPGRAGIRVPIPVEGDTAMIVWIPQPCQTCGFESCQCKRGGK